MGVLKGPWSHSRATSCSLALYKEKVLKAPPEPRPDRILSLDRRKYGSLMHDGSEFILCGILGRRVDKIDSLHADANVVYDLQSKIGLDYKDHERLTHALLAMPFYRHLSDEVDEIHRRLNTFYHRFRMDGEMDVDDRDDMIRNRCLGTELRLAVDSRGKPCSFDDCPPDGFRGIVDYAEDGGDGLLIIRDFKNQPSIFSAADLRNNEQVSGYGNLGMTQFPTFNKLDVGIYYFEFGYEQTMDVSEEQMAANVAKTYARIAYKESLDENDIGPEPGFGKCQYCDYLDSCSAGKKIVEPSSLVPADAESAKELAEWLIVTEEKVEQAKKGLKAFTSEFGPVAIDDKTGVGMAAVPRVVWDKNRVLRIIKGMGLKLSNYTSLNTTEVKKLLKDEDKAAKLKPAMREEKQTRFQVYRSEKIEAVKVKPKSRPVKAKKESEPKRVRGRVKSKARGKGE